MNEQYSINQEVKQRIAKFTEERNKAFLSKDRAKIVEHCIKYNCPIPRSEESFWIMVHKVIAHLDNIDTDQKAESVKWLEDRGFSVSLE